MNIPVVLQDSKPLLDDYGKVITHANLRISWVWLFPLLALIAASLFFFNDWKSNGPSIEIEFHEAPGIQANKTLLFYRGVAAGKVTDVRLDRNLSKAIVTVRLKSFAVPLSQAGTLYWIDQPVIGLAKTSGLSSIVQGNSIQARLGEGELTNHFLGLEKSPLHPLEAPGLILKLAAQDISSLEEASPVTYRGITIGGVMRKEIDSEGKPFLIVGIQKQYADIIRSTCRFWNCSSASLHLGPDGMRVELLNFKAIFVGAIAVDSFGSPGEVVTNGAKFDLYASESEARFEDAGMIFTLSAKEIPGIDVGAPILYHGIIVGKVKSKNLTQDKEAFLNILIKKEFIPTVRQNTKFWRVPATKVQAGPGVLKVTVESLKTLFDGGIAYDVFGDKGDVAIEKTAFQLFPNEESARFNIQPLKMTFDEGQGLLAGQTQVRYLGVPIGIVDKVKSFQGKVEVIAYLEPGYDFLRQPGTDYTIIRSKLAFDGISGLETLVSGVYIECTPQSKANRPVKRFMDKLFKIK
ncbi:MAG: hypothetical protein A3F67_00450 [Verrucomicrobia bacterium RIFCSPHIGHO2_12_FULL_41_10]|nr:MAG: hypothetical protein A3F67_00450 [Verrucomicrobia bacterium RIFCSPHIGHO2_12_FULL_41_10]HLB33847.1 MlaD family protein [Chthoniobacterales bacterium]